MKKLLLIASVLFTSSLGFAQVVSTFPHSEDFESQPLGPTGCGPIYSMTQTTPTWFNGNDAEFSGTYTHSLDWTCDESGTGSSSTGPTANGGADHTTGASGGNYMYIESSCSGTGYPNVTSQFVSPWLDFTALTSPHLEMWYHMFGTSMGTMSVYAQIGSAGAWTQMVTPFTDNLDEWQMLDVDLSAYAASDSVRVRIETITGTSFGSDFAIDDLKFYEPAPYDLEGVSILSSACGEGFQPIVTEYTQVGTDTLFAGDTIYFSYDDGSLSFIDTVILVDTLVAGDVYTHTFSQQVEYIVNNPINMVVAATYPGDPNSGNDTLWMTVDPIPIISTFPYLENFENGNGGWTAVNTTGGAANGTWEFGTPAKTVIQGSGSGYNSFTSGGLTGDYNSNDNSWVLGPCFDFTTLDTGAYVGVKVWWNAEFSWDGSNIQWSVDDGTTWTNIGAFNDPFNWYTDNSINGNPGGNGEGWSGRESSNNGSGGWVQASHMLPDTLIGQSSVKMRFTFGSDGSVQDDGVAFDDFSIGMPDSSNIDTNYADYYGCANVIFDYGSADGFYNFWTQDTATMAITPLAAQINDGLIEFQHLGPDTTTFNLLVNYADPSGQHTNLDTVLITLLPTPYNELMDTIICWDGSATFMVDTASNYTYLWNDATTSVTNMATYDTTIIVSAMVTDTLSGCSHTATAMVTQTAAVDVLTSAHVCVGDTLAIDAGAGFDSYAWNTTDSTQMISVTTAGTYTVTTVDSIGCMSMDSTMVTSSQPMPTITGQQDTLCDYHTLTLNAGAGFSAYSWSTGGSAENEVIDGSNYTAGTTITVTVTVEDSNACSNSDAVSIVIDGCLGIEDLDGLVMSIFPNPSAGVFNYTISDFSQNVALTVVDLSGKVVLEDMLNSAEGTIDLTAYETGVYLLNLDVNGSVTTVRVIKQ